MRRIYNLALWMWPYRMKRCGWPDGRLSWYAIKRIWAVGYYDGK